jgi:Uma2 family endonuclease
MGDRMMNSLTLDMKSVNLTNDQFDQLCLHNPEWRIEQTANGEMIVMAPVGGESGEREARVLHCTHQGKPNQF